MVGEERLLHSNLGKRSWISGLDCIAGSSRSQSLLKLMEARMFPTKPALTSCITLASGQQSDPASLKNLTKVGNHVFQKKKLSFPVEYCALVIFSKVAKQSASRIFYQL